MEQIKLLKGLSTKLALVDVKEGQLLFTTDTGKIYLDAASGTRIELYKGSFEDFKQDIDDLKEQVGTGTVADAIEEAISGLTADDIPELTIAKITGLQDALDAKQDTVVFNSTYDAEDNKAATMADITAATAGLAGAMHFVGVSSTDPSEDGVTIEGKTDFAAGDVVVFGITEWVYDGATWRELGTEGSYAVKGSIKNADIAADAAIDQSKIAGLTQALAELRGETGGEGEEITGESNSIAGAKKYADEKIEALDVTDIAVAGQFVTSVSQVDGKVVVTRETVALDSLVWGSFDTVTEE